MQKLMVFVSTALLRQMDVISASTLRSCIQTVFEDVSSVHEQSPVICIHWLWHYHLSPTTVLVLASPALCNYDIEVLGLDKPVVQGGPGYVTTDRLLRKPEVKITDNAWYQLGHLKPRDVAADASPRSQAELENEVRT
jgi:hypothetical protein